MEKGRRGVATNHRCMCCRKPAERAMCHCASAAERSQGDHHNGEELRLLAVGPSSPHEGILMGCLGVALCPVPFSRPNVTATYPAPTSPTVTAARRATSSCCSRSWSGERRLSLLIPDPVARMVAAAGAAAVAAAGGRQHPHRGRQHRGVRATRLHFCNVALLLAPLSSTPLLQPHLFRSPHARSPKRFERTGLSEDARDQEQAEPERTAAAPHPRARSCERGPRGEAAAPVLARLPHRCGAGHCQVLSGDPPGHEQGWNRL